MSSKTNLESFVKALKNSEIQAGQAHAACHHSAVEVNDWEQISRELVEVLAQDEAAR